MGFDWIYGYYLYLRVSLLLLDGFVYFGDVSISASMLTIRHEEFNLILASRGVWNLNFRHQPIDGWFSLFDQRP